MGSRAVDLTEFMATHGLCSAQIKIKIHTPHMGSIVVQRIGLLEPEQGVKSETTSASNILQPK